MFAVPRCGIKAFSSFRDLRKWRRWNASARRATPSNAPIGILGRNPTKETGHLIYSWKDDGGICWAHPFDIECANGTVVGRHEDPEDLKDPA